MQSVEEQKNLVIFINDKKTPPSELIFSSNLNLKTTRERLGNIMSKDQLFFIAGKTEVAQSDEEKYLLKDVIVNDNELHIKDSNCSQKDSEQPESNSLIPASSSTPKPQETSKKAEDFESREKEEEVKTEQADIENECYDEDEDKMIKSKNKKKNKKKRNKKDERLFNELKNKNSNLEKENEKLHKKLYEMTAQCNQFLLNNEVLSKDMNLFRKSNLNIINSETEKSKGGKPYKKKKVMKVIVVMKEKKKHKKKGESDSDSDSSNSSDSFESSDSSSSSEEEKKHKKNESDSDSSVEKRRKKHKKHKPKKHKKKYESHSSDEEEKNKKKNDEKIDDSEVPSVPCIALENLVEIKTEGDVKYYKFPVLSQEIKEGKNPEDPKIHTYYHDSFTSQDKLDAKVILYVGKTGDGKTTNINAFINVLYGVKFTDKFRYILIEEEKKSQIHSQTMGIHIHYLKDPKGVPIMIIDSQGYLDTRNTILSKDDVNSKDSFTELNKIDEKITQTFTELFTTEIDHVNVVAFVKNSTEPKMTDDQAYLFAKISSLFSEDVITNFVVIATKCGYGDVIIEDALKSDKSFFSKHLNTISPPWLFKFDSRTILDDPKGVGKALYEANEREMQSFIQKKVYDLYPKPIKQSEEILNKRRSLQEKLSGLSLKLKNLSKNQQELEKKKIILDKQKAKVKNFRKELSGIIEKIDLIKNDEASAKLYDKIFLQKMEEYEREMRDSEEEARKIRFVRTLVKSSYKNYYCFNCESNCHPTCDCWFWCNCIRKDYEWVNGSKITKYVCSKCGCSDAYHNRDEHIYKETELAQDKKIFEERKKRAEENKKQKESERIEQQKKINEAKDKKYEAISAKEAKEKQLMAMQNKIEEIEKETKICQQELNKNISESIAVIILMKETVNEINKTALNKTVDEALINYANSLLRRANVNDKQSKENAESVQNKINEMLSRKEIVELNIEGLKDEEIIEKVMAIMSKFNQ